MPLKINGHSFSWPFISAVLVTVMSFGGLTYQVNANSDEIQKQSETKERLVRLEEQRETVADDITEIKTTQKSTQAAVVANRVLLARILAVVERDE